MVCPIRIKENVSVMGMLADYLLSEVDADDVSFANGLYLVSEINLSLTMHN